MTGAPLREYVWLGWMPVAFVDYSSGLPVTYYVHADQVMTPQKLTDALGAVVWDRVQDPFGVEVSATGSLTQPLRFPGQTADIESSFNQNWNRDYDPSLGRYIQSDPIGLMGGINTYAYVEGNPVTRVDETGEFAAPAIPYAAGAVAQVALMLFIALYEPPEPPSEDNFTCSGGGDSCDDQYDKDMKWCGRQYSYSRDAYRKCAARAAVNRDLCKRGLPELGPWSDFDEDGVRMPKSPGKRKRGRK